MTDIIKVEDFEKVQWLSITDDDILSITDGRFVTNPVDFNLRKGPRNSEGFLSPIPGGLYDGRIFGSIYENRCNCGAITVPNVPCMECGTVLLDNIQRKIRYAAIDAGVYYTTPIKVKHLMNLLRKNFTIKINFNDPIFKDKIDLTKDYKIMTLLYFSQVDYEERSNALMFSDTLDDVSKLSLEGIESIIKSHKPEILEDFKKLVNRYVIVTPAIYRKVKFCVIKGKKEIKLPKSTAYYKSLLIAVNTCKKQAQETDDIYSVACHYANLRLYISMVLTRMSRFLKPSKQSATRGTYSTNSSHSGRAVICADPKLPIDTIGIPRVLAYEMYKKQFLKYLIEVIAMNQSEAVKRYNNPDEEVNHFFDDFVKDKVVLINRPPSIHRQNIQAYKVTLSEDYGIHFPLLTTQAQNADFDGDAVMFFAIPDEIKDYVFQAASPIHYTNYVTDGTPILKARHEILYGLTIATKVIEGDEVRKFTSLEEIRDAFNKDEIWVYDKIDYMGQITSYGRLRLATILKVPDLDNIPGIGTDPINSKNIAEVYRVINAHTPEERVGILQKMQEFALEVVTLEGSTSINLKDLYYDVPKEYRDKINAVLNSEVPEKDKIREAEAIHEQMVADLLDPSKGLSQGTVDRINEGNRGKMSAVIAMCVPAFNIDAEGKLNFAEHSLVEGLTEAEFMYHSQANREALKTKANMTPFGGFMTRQLKEAGDKIIMIQGQIDADNECILIPAKLAKGRTMKDGKTVGSDKSDKMVAVRSCLTTSLPYVTEDMFSRDNQFNYDVDGRCFIGTDWMTAFSSDIVQSGLSLKHQSTMRFVEQFSKFKAPYDTEVEYIEDKIILKATGEEYILPTRWSTRGPGFYKKGDLIGEVPDYKTFTIKVESLVKLFKAQGSLKYREMSNNIDMKECFNRSTESKLEYRNGEVRVGKLSWRRNRDFIPYPIGSMIPPYARIRAGLQNMINLNKSNISTRFNIFYNQVNELRPINIELAEMIFKILTNNGKDYQGLQRANTKNNPNALSAAGYGYARSAMTRVVPGDLKIDTQQPLSQVLLTPMFWKLIAAINKK